MLLTDTIERALVLYTDYIHQQAWKAADKLPRATLFSHDDLVSEGHEQLVRCHAAYDEAMGFKFITYFGNVLVHRYLRIIEQEWIRGGRLKREVLGKPRTASEQEAWTMARMMLGGKTVEMPDRYLKLRKARRVLSKRVVHVLKEEFVTRKIRVRVSAKLANRLIP